MVTENNFENAYTKSYLQIIHHVATLYNCRSDQFTVPKLGYPIKLILVIQFLPIWQQV
jgi:hypothetical protein